MMTMGRGTTPESKVVFKPLWFPVAYFSAAKLLNCFAQMQLNEILEKRRENEQVLESTGTKARAFCFTAQRQRPDASRINK